MEQSIIDKDIVIKPPRLLGDRKSLYSEINLAIALPFKERVRKGHEHAAESLIKICNEQVNNVLKIKLLSERGAVSGLVYDVLNVLMDMANEQYKELLSQVNDFDERNFFVTYTHREICQKLNLDPNQYRGKISNAILTLQKVMLQITGHIYRVDTQEYERINSRINLIRSIKENSRMSSRSKGGSIKALDFDPFIIKLLGSDFSVNRESYLQLKVGKQRRTFMFLQAKREVFGDHFSFDELELSTILGIETLRKDNRKRIITKVLEEIRENLDSFDFFMKSIYGTGTLEIMVEYNKAKDSFERTYKSKFYSDLVFDYTLEELEVLSFYEADCVNLEEELDRKISKREENLVKDTSFGKLKLSSFIIDCALFQIINTGYSNIRSPKKLAGVILQKALDGQMLIPDGYNKFVSKRVSDTKNKIKSDEVRREFEKRKIRLEEEEVKENQVFEKYWDEFVLSETNSKLKDRYMEEADKLVSDEFKADDPFASMLRPQAVQLKAKEIAKKEFFSTGKFLDRHLENAPREISFEEQAKFLLGNDDLNLLS